MSDNRWREIALDGLWRNNPGLVQLLGLCPLLAVTDSVVKALGLGLATLLVLTASSLVVSLLRHGIGNAVRLPAFVIIIAAFTSCADLLMQAFTYELHQMLGIFVPLIVSNCVILSRVDTFASKNRPLPAALDGFMMGCGFLLLLALMGSIREILGGGTWLANMHLLFGEPARNWTLHPFGGNYQGFLLALMPPGAFLVAGGLIALKNVLDARSRNQQPEQRVPAPKGSKRVRTTGHIV